MSCSITIGLLSLLKRDIEDMIESMNAFTNNSLNAIFAMGYRNVIDLHIGSRNYHWYYVQGERIVAPTRQLKRNVFESYRGVFWESVS